MSGNPFGMLFVSPGRTLLRLAYGRQAGLTAFYVVVAIFYARMLFGPASSTEETYLINR
jgi:hypothetical protein